MVKVSVARDDSCFYNLLLCNNHYRENTGYAIPGWDMTCDKVPQVEIWHTLAERTQNAAKTMTVLKGSFTFHSHTIIFTGWKPSKIFFFFFFMIRFVFVFFSLWQQNTVTNTNPPPFTLFLENNINTRFIRPGLTVKKNKTSSSPKPRP